MLPSDAFPHGQCIAVVHGSTYNYYSIPLSLLGLAGGMVPLLFITEPTKTKYLSQLDFLVCHMESPTVLYCKEQRALLSSSLEYLDCGHSASDTLPPACNNVICMCRHRQGLTTVAAVKQTSGSTKTADYFSSDDRPVILFDGVCNL